MTDRTRFTEPPADRLTNEDAEPVVSTVPDRGLEMRVMCRACLPPVSVKYVPPNAVPKSTPVVNVTLHYGHFIERRPGKKADGTDYAVEVDYFAYVGRCPKCGQGYVAKIVSGPD